MSAISRRLRFEWLEDRQLLAKADIVFLVDESLSNEENPVKPWLRTVVTGDADGNGIAEMTPLASQLAINGVTDIRYGLVGFGEQSGGGGKGVRNRFSAFWACHGVARWIPGLTVALPGRSSLDRQRGCRG